MGAAVREQIQYDPATSINPFSYGDVPAFPGGSTYKASPDGKPLYKTSPTGTLPHESLKANITTMPFGGMWGEARRHESLSYLPTGGVRDPKNKPKTTARKIQRNTAQQASSGYGVTNGDEFWAELFLEAIGSDSPRPAAAMLRSELDDLWAVLQAEGVLG